MTAEQWKEQLGEDAWNYICGGSPMQEPHEFGQTIIASLLSRLTEVGWTPPKTKAQVSRGATAVKIGDSTALTARGLLQHWQSKGHGWLLFRLEPLMKAVAGPLLPRLQQIWTAYEAQVAEDDLRPEQIIPKQWYGFVGGTKMDWDSRHSGDDWLDMHYLLQEPVPEVPPSLTHKTAKGPE